jgi:8-oxo-dGTP diphosphatase
MTVNISECGEIVFGEKLEGIEYIDRAAVYGIAFDNKGRVAAVKTPVSYFLPGGGIEKEETHEECIKREFMEETGYSIEVDKYIGKASLYHISKKGYYMHGIGYFYTVNLKCGTDGKKEEDHELLWLEPSDCISKLFLRHQAWAVSKTLDLKYL